MLTFEYRGLGDDRFLSDYRQAWEYLDGQGDIGELRERGIAATRQLAKRQLTWLRGELDARWFDPVRHGAGLDEAVAMFLDRSAPMPARRTIPPV